MLQSLARELCRISNLPGRYSHVLIIMMKFYNQVFSSFNIYIVAGYLEYLLIVTVIQTILILNPYPSKNKTTGAYL